MQPIYLQIRQRARQIILHHPTPDFYRDMRQPMRYPDGYSIAIPLSKNCSPLLKKTWKMISDTV
jgi:hypothetical protein